MSNQLTVTQQAVVNIRRLVESEGYQKRFEGMLGPKRAPAFIASIGNIVSQSDELARCEPRSIIMCAAMAATLDFPIEKSLGFVYIVAYGQTATFQLGYKGLIQLALRSGQYASMRDAAINAEAFKGYDEVGEPIIDWAHLDETKDPVGYAFSWRTNNGFKKTVYWSRAKVLAHAKRFSKSFGSNKSPWQTSQEAMALKTVIRAALSKYGILSVEMQRAMGAEDVELVEGPEGMLLPKGEPLDGAGAPPEPEPEKTMSQTLKDKKAKAVEKNVTEPPAEQKGAEAPAQATEARETKENADIKPAPGDAGDANEPEVDRDSLIGRLQDKMLDKDVSEDRLFAYAKKVNLVHEGAASVWELKTADLAKLEKAIPAISASKKA